MFPKHLMDSDDDWQEGLALWLYPRLHPLLKRFGGYSIGRVGYGQYVGTFDEDEEVIEDELVSVGAFRNPMAALKSLPDGRIEEGSWRVTYEDDLTGRIEPGMQVHIHLFEREDGKPGRELYAHYEDDWGAAPIAHLHEENFSVETGVEIASELIDEHSYLIRLQK